MVERSSGPACGFPWQRRFPQAGFEQFPVPSPEPTSGSHCHSLSLSLERLALKSATGCSVRLSSLADGNAMTIGKESCAVRVAQTLESTISFGYDSGATSYDGLAVRRKLLARFVRAEDFCSHGPVAHLCSVPFLPPPVTHRLSLPHEFIA